MYIPFADALKLLLKEYVRPAQATGYFALSLQSHVKQKVSTVIPLLLSIVNFIVYAINDSAYLTGYFSDLFLASRISLYGDKFKDDYYNLLLSLYLNHGDLILIETA